jgi:DNA polymerase-1
MSVVILDGTYQLSRAVHSSGGDLVSSTGIPTGGIFTFLKMLWNFKDFGTPIAAFDWMGARSSFRRAIYPEYKVREQPKTEEELIAKEENRKFMVYSFNSLRDLLPKMGVPFVVVQDQEGDDVVYHLAKHHSKLGEEVWVVSDDKDYLQFLNLPNVRVYQPIKDLKWDKAYFLEHYGFDSTYFVLFKSIIGDGSDNIDGVYGVGEKTAAKIMKELKEPTILALLEWANAGEKAVHKKIKEGLPIIKRNLMLIDLDQMALSEETVMSVYTQAKQQTSVDVQFVVERFKTYEFYSFGTWLTHLMHQKTLGK